MWKTVDVDVLDDILPEYRGTPIELLFRYHNLKEPQPVSTGAPMLFVAMCMDNRKTLNVPREFAYVLRTAGARLRGNEFELTFAIAIGGVSTVALIGHTDCGMSTVLEKRAAFVDGLVERAQIHPGRAERHFDSLAGAYAIASPIESTMRQAAAVHRHLPGVLVAPLLYRVEDDRLTQIVEATGADAG